MYENFDHFLAHTEMPVLSDMDGFNGYHAAAQESENVANFDLLNNNDIDALPNHTDIDFGAPRGLISSSWDGGVAYSDITPDTVHDISDKIMHTFGTYGMQIEQMPGIFNAGVSVGDSKLVYDQNFLWTVGEQYGTEAIGGIIAHEIGHQVVNDLYSNSNIHMTHWQQELCADFISGISSQLNGLSPDAMHHFYSEFDVAQGGIDHPVGGLRAEAFDKGVEWASNHNNAVFSEFLLQSPSHLNDMLEQNILGVFPDSAESYVSMGSNNHTGGEHAGMSLDYFGKDNPPPPPPSSESIGDLAAYENDTFSVKDDPLPKEPPETTTIHSLYEKMLHFGSTGERGSLEHELSIAKDRFNSANSRLESLIRNKADGMSGVDPNISDVKNEMASATTRINDINYKLSNLKD